MKSTTYDGGAMSHEVKNNLLDIDNIGFLCIPFHKEFTRRFIT